MNKVCSCEKPGCLYCETYALRALEEISAKKTISVSIKMAYGNERIYPICDKAKLFAKLTGKLSMTRADINLIKQLGYEIIVIQEKVNL